MNKYLTPAQGLLGLVCVVAFAGGYGFAAFSNSNTEQAVVTQSIDPKSDPLAEDSFDHGLQIKSYSCSYPTVYSDPMRDLVASPYYGSNKDDLLRGYNSATCEEVFAEEAENAAREDDLAAELRAELEG